MAVGVPGSLAAAPRFYSISQHGRPVGGAAIKHVSRSDHQPSAQCLFAIYYRHRRVVSVCRRRNAIHAPPSAVERASGGTAPPPRFHSVRLAPADCDISLVLMLFSANRLVSAWLSNISVRKEGRGGLDEGVEGVFFFF